MKTTLRLAAIAFMVASTVLAIQSFASVFGYGRPGLPLSTLFLIVSYLAWEAADRLESR